MRASAALLACAAALAVSVAPAHADFGLQPGGFSVEALQADGTTPETQAGAHPDSLRVELAFNEKSDPYLGQVSDGDVKDLVVDLPRGILAAPGSLPQCEWGDFNASFDYDASPQCDPSTQLGIAHIDLAEAAGPFHVPIYNLVPRPGHPADLGMFVSGVRLVMEGDVRSDGDYGLRTSMHSISQVMGLRRAEIVLWGVPADPSHDPDRAKKGDGQPTGAPAGVPERPFLTNPSECAGERTATVTYRSWDDPSTWLTASDTLPPVTGCDQLSFAPAIDVRPATTRADSPTGVDIEVTLPDDSDPDALGGALLRSAVTRLPAGLSISPGAAHGLEVCSDPAACPAASKVGEVTIETPALSVPLTGPIHLGSATADAPYRLFVSASGAGVDIRLVGELSVDPANGQLTTRFVDAPQQPFTRLRLHLKGGPQALLATPQSCGTYTTTTEMTSWGGQTATPSDDLVVDGCDGAAFAPAFSAGVVDAVAGLSSPFVMRITRGDGQPGIAGVRDVQLPRGLLADVRGFPLCGLEEAAAGTCGEESRIGTMTVAAGSGPAPFRLPGSVYLTQGSGGAPMGLAFVVRALAGPYDLGTVVVRGALRVRPDGSLVVDTEPFPSILGGIPLRLREIELSLDRPGFMRNPTSCDEQRVAATVVAVDGAAAPVGRRFQVGGCDGLPFAPRFTAVSDGSSATGGAALRVSVAGRRGDANLRTVRMTLPRALSARLSTVGNACKPAQHAANACPEASRVGTARVVTAILDEPLRGPAYLVESGSALPTPAARLEGGGLVVPVTGRIELVDGRLTATFDDIPDVPILDFTLDLPMGPNSALAASGGLCDEPLVAPTRIVAQSGKVFEQDTRIAVAGCSPRIVRTVVRGRRAVVTVAGLPGPGTLSLRGRGVRPARSTVRAAGVARIGATLTRRGARRARRLGRLRVPLRIGFRPAAGTGERASTLRTVATFRVRASRRRPSRP
ncbi:MAG TPA: hypothetical protein VF529_14175 [Solirubrobacteraceae bacterium]|jgi:hypothetical protein